jgi:hypothetical protein
VDAHALGVHHRAARARSHERHGLSQGAERVEEILAVAVDDLDVQEPGEIVRGETIRGLVALRNGDAIAVVLHDEDDGQLLARRAVDGLVEVALGRGRLAQ